MQGVQWSSLRCIKIMFTFTKGRKQKRRGAGWEQNCSARHERKTWTATALMIIDDAGRLMGRHDPAYGW
jgi:hypothetical protein